MEAYIPFNKGAIRPVDCIREGWEIIKDRYWLFFLFVLIGAIIILFIPILRWFLYGPMLVGAFYAVLQKSRGQHVSGESFLKGFNIFVRAMVVGLIESFFQLFNDVVSIFLNVTSLFIQMMNMDKFPSGPPPPYRPSAATQILAASDLEKMMAGIAGFLVLIVLILLIVSVAVAFVWRITFMFALPLMADHPELKPLEAIALGARAGWANAGGIILLLLLQWVWMMLGFIAICIGMLFVAPVIIASDMAAYRMVFPEMQPADSVYNEPPRPDYYGGSFGQGM